MNSEAAPSPPSPPRRRLSVRRVVTSLAVAYTAALLVVVVLLRFVGEAWWVTTAGLYLPRIGFALPLPILALALLVAGPRRLLWFVPVPALLLVYPLMGLNLNLGASALVAPAVAAGPALRVLSYNIQSAGNPAALGATITRLSPDLVLLQEWDERAAEPLFEALPGFQRHVSGQFALFSRHPVLEVYVPPRVIVGQLRDRGPRFVRYTIETPLGRAAVLNVHPVSPRNGLEEFRRNGLLEQWREGTVAPLEGIEALRTNAGLRWRQAEAIVEEATRASAQTEGRVIIAGDTNLPGLSRIFALTLAPFHDGFSEAGRGFGYTFPAERPWMRIDRILASGSLRFTRFEVLPDGGSDHLAVTATLTRR